MAPRIVDSSSSFALRIDRSLFVRKVTNGTLPPTPMPPTVLRRLTWRQQRPSERVAGGGGEGTEDDRMRFSVAAVGIEIGRRRPRAQPAIR